MWDLKEQLKDVKNGIDPKKLFSWLFSPLRWPRRLSREPQTGGLSENDPNLRHPAEEFQRRANGQHASPASAGKQHLGESGNHFQHPGRGLGGGPSRLAGRRDFRVVNCVITTAIVPAGLTRFAWQSLHGGTNRGWRWGVGVGAAGSSEKTTSVAPFGHRAAWAGDGNLLLNLPERGGTPSFFCRPSP